MAHRLTENKKHSVAILEYGGGDHGPFIQMPSALSYPMNMSSYNWGYSTEPEENLNNRVLSCPRGKVIGGSSSINGMIYVRGNPGDFDHWEKVVEAVKHPVGNCHGSATNEGHRASHTP